MPTPIGEKIVKFSGTASGEDQIPVTTLINNVTDRAITIEKKTLNSFFERNFRIPDYQRGYQWEKEQWEELWEEIDKLYTADGNSAQPQISDIFFGSMFFAEQDIDAIEEDDIEELYDIIDGQQRVTTLTVLFKIIAEHMHYHLDEGELYRELGGEVTNVEELVYRDTGVGTEQNVSLIPNRHHKSFFTAMLTGDEELLKYLVECDRVHGNTKYDAIRISEFLEPFDIDSETYLHAIDDNDYYPDGETGRPNLTTRQASRVNDGELLAERDQESDREVTSDETETEADDRPEIDVDGGLAQDLLQNKVEISEENQNFIKCYLYFDKQITNRLEEFDTHKEKIYSLINITNYILHSFRVGYFEVQNSQPRLLMRIFEILNDRGMELKKADVMRTRIVACFRGDPERDIYVDKWEDIVNEFGNDRIIEFLRTFFVTKGDANSRGELRDHLLEAFVQNPSEGSDTKLESRLTSTSEAKSFLDEMSRYSQYYNDITDINNEGIDLGDSGDEAIEYEADRIIARLQKADTSVWEPLVLGFYHDIVENDTTEQQQLLDLLHAIESMAIRKFASMDTHTRDRAYSLAISEYHERGINAEVIETLTDIETTDPNAVGEPLVEALYQSKWRSQWGKQVLRKIVSENFSGSDSDMVLRRLNLNEDIIHLEHIFPQSPIRSNADDEYAWFKKFFKTDAGTEVGDMIESFVNDEADDVLEEIAEHYLYDIGNLTLLHYTGNLSIGNKLFDEKARVYKTTNDFCEMATSTYICENLFYSYTSSLEHYLRVEAGRDKLDAITDGEGDEQEAIDWTDIRDQFDLEADTVGELREEIDEVLAEQIEAMSDLKDEWTYDAVTKNRAHLVEELCDLIAFDDDEFNDVDFEDLSEEITTTENQIIAANFRRRMS